MRTAKMTWALRIGLMAATGVLVAWRISSAVIAPGRNVDGPVASPVVATVETVPVRSGGDAADDAAIWLHPTDGSQSTIIGTDKKKGLVVYDLTGRELQYLPDGKLVNVDLRHDFPLDNRHTSIVASGGRGNHGIAVYAIDESTRLLRNVSAGALKVGVQVYGSCMYRSPVTGSHYVFVTSKSGEVEQWQLFETVPGQVGARRVRSFDVGVQGPGTGKGDPVVGPDGPGEPEVLERPLKDGEGKSFTSGRQRLAGDEVATGEVADGQRITVSPVGQHELPLVVRTPELVRRRRPGERGALGFVAAPFPTRYQAMAVEHRVDGADRRAGEIRIPAAEPRTDLRRPPPGILPFERDDQRLDLHRELISVPVGPPAPVGQALEAAILVARVDLVAGLAGNAELPAQASHLLTIQQAGNKAETFVHDLTLLPGHHSLPRKRRKCYPCLQNEVSPFSREGHVLLCVRVPAGPFS